MADRSLAIDSNEVVVRGDAVRGNLGFEEGEQDIRTAPAGWLFNGTGEAGGVFHEDVPERSQYASTQSFGSPSHQHPITGTEMGTWSVTKTYAVSQAGEDLTIECWAQCAGTIPDSPTYTDGSETFVGEDDAFLGVSGYAADGSETVTSASETALHQLYERIGVTGQEDGWFPLAHELTLPAGTATIDIELVATDGNSTVHPLGYRAANAGVLFDDVRVEYPTGLAEAHGVSGGSVGDAETLDGYDSSAFGVLAEDETVSGSWSFTGTPTANRLDVNGISGAASNDGNTGLGTPAVYTNVVEAQGEKGPASTYLELGAGGPNTDINADEIGFVTNGTVQARLDSGGFKLEGNEITGLADPTAGQHAVTRSWSQTYHPNLDSNGHLTGSLNFGGNNAINLADPTAGQHATTKSYVDSADTTTQNNAESNAAAYTEDLADSVGTVSIPFARIPAGENAEVPIINTNTSIDILEVSAVKSGGAGETGLYRGIYQSGGAIVFHTENKSQKGAIDNPVQNVATGTDGTIVFGIRNRTGGERVVGGFCQFRQLGE